MSTIIYKKYQHFLDEKLPFLELYFFFLLSYIPFWEFWISKYKTPVPRTDLVILCDNVIGTSNISAGGGFCCQCGVGVKTHHLL